MEPVSTLPTIISPVANPRSPSPRRHMTPVQPTEEDCCKRKLPPWVVDPEKYESAVRLCREKEILLPTFEQLANPALVPQQILSLLREKNGKGVCLEDIDPLNLFRITWYNETRSGERLHTPPTTTEPGCGIPVVPESEICGGGFANLPNFVEIPKEISGVDARIILLLGRFMPTGAHKIGSMFGPLVSRLVRGEIDPERSQPMFPSSGNAAKAGCFLSRCLGIEQPIAIIPPDVEPERVQYLEDLGAEVVVTAGVAGKVKEISGKAVELETRFPDTHVHVDQFSDFSNSAFHYYCTGSAMDQVYNAIAGPQDHLAAVCVSVGSGGAINCGQFIKERHYECQVVAGEPLQSATMLFGGYSYHRIAGVGDSSIPYIFSPRHTDVACGVSDEQVVRAWRLFNTQQGHDYLSSLNVCPHVISKLPLLGISSIANLATAIKTAKYFELGSHDIIFSLATDSSLNYQSLHTKLDREFGPMTEAEVVISHCGLKGIQADHFDELSHYSKKRLSNFKYWFWVEQRGFDLDDLESQWSDRDYFRKKFAMISEYDKWIIEFNRRTGMAKHYGDVFQLRRQCECSHTE